MTRHNSAMQRALDFDFEPRVVAQVVPVATDGPEALSWLPSVPRSDKIIRAFAQAELPSGEMVAAAQLRKNGNLGDFYILWAMHVIADMHIQTPTGLRFKGPDDTEASRYAAFEADLPLWWDSKSENGGAKKLTQSGYNAIMYGARQMRGLKRRSYSPKRDIITNDGGRMVGYRVVTGGPAFLAFYKQIAKRIKDDALRRYCVQIVDQIEEDPVQFVRSRRSPSHARYMLSIFAGYNRSGGHSYLSFRISEERREDLLKMIFGEDPVPDKVSFRIKAFRCNKEVGPDRFEQVDMIGLMVDPRGYTLSGNTVQLSTMANANLEELPKLYFNQRVEAVNLAFRPWWQDGARGIAVELPPGFFEVNHELNGTGLRSRASAGSTSGRRRAAEKRQPLQKTRVFEGSGETITGRVTRA